MRCGRSSRISSVYAAAVPVGLKGDPPAEADCPGCTPGVTVVGHVCDGAPGWPVTWPEGVVLGGGGVVLGGAARAVRVPKADSMTTTIAEASLLHKLLSYLSGLVDQATFS